MKRKIKSLAKRIECFFNKYINGVSGAVSLLLVLVLSPLLSTALILVESARYQDAIQLTEEVMGSAAFSTLANYDEYLDERFGLLSISQKTNIQNDFSNYLSENHKALGKSITVDSTKAYGEFALSNTDVLKQQLLEYGEISVAAEVVTEGIDLNDLLNKLSGALNLDDLKKEMNAVSSGLDLVSKVKRIIEDLNDAINQYNNKYSPALTEYKDAYTTFETKANDHISALKAAEGALAEDDEHDKIYNDNKVKDAIKELKESGKTYKETATTLNAEFLILKKEIESIINAVASLTSTLQDFETKSSESTLAGDDIYKWLKIVVEQLTTSIYRIVGNDFKNTSDGEIQNLSAQIIKLDKLEDKTITSNWTTEKVQSEYGGVGISSVSNKFGTSMQNLVKNLDEAVKTSNNSDEKMWDILDVAGEIIGISGLYDGNLNAVVSSSALHAKTNMSISSQLSLKSLTDLLDSLKSIKKSILPPNFLNTITAVVKLFKSVVEFLASIIAWVGEMFVNLATYVSSGPEEWYNGILLYGYGAYNLPNRTNYNSGNTISGYSYNEIYKMAGGHIGEASIKGSFKELSTIGNEIGNDKMFKGAETEYVLVGSTSELQNQSVAFFDLYLLRLVLDIIPVLKNKEVSAISALAGPFAWAVKLAIALAEPMLDTIVLVNGGKEYFFKDTVYLSASGLFILFKDLVGIASITDGLKNKMKDTMKGTNKVNDISTEKGYCDGSYAEHMLVLMLLSVNQQTFMQRVQNLIQMEAAEKNKSTFPFDLDKAYTYVYTDVTYTLNPMFNIDSLTAGGLFTKTSKQYSGY